MEKLICANCGKQFTTTERNTAVTERDEDDTLYCGKKCKKQAANKRYYQAHRVEVIARNLENQGYET